MDVISKEEFDSQRGIDEQRDDGDSDLVFPLDLQEPSTKPEVTAASTKPATEEPRQPHQERSVERGGREMSPSKGSSNIRPKKGKWEKRARFYPVPVKQDSPTKVCVHVTQLCVNIRSVDDVILHVEIAAYDRSVCLYAIV